MMKDTLVVLRAVGISMLAVGAALFLGRFSGGSPEFGLVVAGAAVLAAEAWSRRRPMS